MKTGEMKSGRGKSSLSERQQEKNTEKSPVEREPFVCKQSRKGFWRGVFRDGLEAAGKGG